MRAWTTSECSSSNDLTGIAAVRYTADELWPLSGTQSQGDVAQLVRAGVSYALGPWFESTHRHPFSTVLANACCIVLALGTLLASGCASPMDHSSSRNQDQDPSEVDPDNTLNGSGCQGPGCFELGGQIAGSLEQGISTMQSAGMNWVKYQHKYNGGSAGVLSGVIADAHSKGFKVLISVTGQERPSAIDFEGVIRFLGELATFGPDAIEVWNEPNIDREWPSGTIHGSNYVTSLLKPAYDAIKAANSNVLVISGAPAPTGYFGAAGCTEAGCNDDVFVRDMIAAGGKSAMDCLGVHHNSGATSPDATSGHPADPPEDGYHYSWYFKPQLTTYGSLLGANTIPLCLTELGYLSGEDYGGVPSQFSWASGTTVADHATWLGEAVSMCANGTVDPNVSVRLAIIFNVNYESYSSDPQAGYAIVRKDGTCHACGPLSSAMQ